MSDQVRCRSCGCDSERAVREDTGGYGRCHKCGGVMARPEIIAGKRCRQAQREIAGLAKSDPVSETTVT